MNTKRSLGSDESVAFPRWRPRTAETGANLSAANAREKWRAALRERLAPLTSLEEGWDAYSAGGVKTQTVIFAAQVLDDIWATGLPVPDVMPTSTESVYVEWSTARFDFSIEIKAPYVGSFYFEDAATGKIHEGEFRDNLVELENLSRQAVAAGLAG